MLYYTQSWYGYYQFHSTILFEDLFSRIDHMVGCFNADVYRCLNEAKAENDLADLMYVFMLDDSRLKKSINHQIYYIALGYLICQVYGGIALTETNKKKFFYIKLAKLYRKLSTK
jgi:hypothetical protein